MKQILVVDDDMNVQELIKTRLSANGYKVSVAEDGLEALSKLKKRKPALVILDVCMPHFDGLSFLQEMRSDAKLRDIPVLVLTGAKNMRDLFVPVKMARFMTKPFNGDDLLTVVSDCIGTTCVK